MAKQMKTFSSNKYRLAIGEQSQKQVVNNELSVHSVHMAISCSGGHLSNTYSPKPLITQNVIL